MKVNSVLRKFFLCVAFVSGICFSGFATHLRAGEIIVERESCNSLTFVITVTVFTNTIGTNVLFGGEDDWLDFGDGSQPFLVPEQQNIPRPDLGEGVATASYTIRHTYPGFQSYTISYSEPNRNAGVLNMDGSVNTRFYIETQIIVDPFLGCNNTPKLLIPPIDRGCTGVAFYHNPGAFDPEGDSLSYKMVIPFRDRDTQVINYKDPNNPKFYNNYATANEDGTGPPTFGINAIDGTLTWDAPGMAGEYNVAFVVEEWRKINGIYYFMGFVRRDMQIIINDCKNQRPDMTIPKDICVEAGTKIDATVFGTDPDGDPVKIEAFSEIFNFPAAQSPATFTPYPPDFVSSVPSAQLKFEWQTECSHVKEQPYAVVFKITDKSAGAKLVTFKTWFIRVVGPKPKWVSANVNLAKRVTNLKWDGYQCQNAETMEVWRRVGSFAFVPDSCQTGMPANLGYTKIADLPIQDNTGAPVTTYVDNNGGRGLDAGAEYCYRLVAIFPAPRNGESLVSEEICVPPILVDEPVITNVSIDKTGTTDGQIFVRWTPPFQIDKTQYPPPYEYEVYRAEGFAGGTGILKVSGTGHLSDTTFTDVGMNTKDIVYNYRVVLWSQTSQSTAYAAVDTSSTASTVRLEAKSEFKKITLDWSAFVPWSNIIQTQPNQHVLYRGSGGSTESQLQPIANIDPTTSGLQYIDEGQSNGVPLSDTQEYCYRVMTRGSYGNPQIKFPLENYSQIICAQPNDSIPPCKVGLSIQLSNCENVEFLKSLCGTNVFNNTLYWKRPQGDCAADISGYRIYRARSADADFSLLNTVDLVRDTFYIDSNLDSYAYCYKISAVDRSGNESDLSEPACNDNCPYYELPNVFSPGSDDCNNKFSAYGTADRYRASGEETGGYVCGGKDYYESDDFARKCARFVQKVNFKVFNRWGREVYTYESGSERTIYVDWDGRASDGTELSAGVYYYVADVIFNSVDPKKQNQTFKGWVQILR
jgi:hypothetical protein